MHVADFAEDMAGNFLRFESFWMSSDVKPEDPDRWCVVYTSNRDSDALERSNARVIEKTLDPFLVTGEDIQHFGASHWGVGYVDGYLIRVYREDGSITAAFEAYAGLHFALADYPILDEEDYSEEEMTEANEVWSAPGFCRPSRLDFDGRHTKRCS